MKEESCCHRRTEDKITDKKVKKYKYERHKQYLQNWYFLNEFQETLQGFFNHRVEGGRENIEVRER